MRVQSQIVINRPADEVFAGLTDAPTTVKGASATEKAWWATPPPHGVGSVRRATGVIMGQPYENEATVTEHDPPNREVLTGSQSGVKFQVVIACAPDASSGGTRVTVTSDLALTGGLRFLGGATGGQHRQMWDADMATLKRMMESGELLDRLGLTSVKGSEVQATAASARCRSARNAGMYSGKAAAHAMPATIIAVESEVSVAIVVSTMAPIAAAG